MFTAKEKIELAALDIKLGNLPAIKLAPRAPIDDKRKTYIKGLIAELATVKDPDFGLSGTLTGEAFSPLPDQQEFHAGLLTDHELKTSNAFRKLVRPVPMLFLFCSNRWVTIHLPS